MKQRLLKGFRAVDSAASAYAAADTVVNIIFAAPCTQPPRHNTQVALAAKRRNI